ncbi:MAG: hypothetical protein IPH58_16655 [Sphingobacteriales bacterium]|nr:hypothetical protein [Sphingobacteriales bacterium]
MLRKFDEACISLVDVSGTTYHGNLMEKPFVAKHRAFINLAYSTLMIGNLILLLSG